MSTASIPFTLTTAGIDAAFNNGALNLEVTHIQIGSGNRTPNGTETALVTPRESNTIAGAFEVSAGQWRISAVIPGSALSYTISEIGLWAGVPGQPGSTLVFYWALPTGSVATKSVSVAFNFESDLVFGTVVPGDITIVADTSFNALAMLAQHNELADPHGLALPFAALDYPTIGTSDNKMTVTPATVAGQGGKVSTPSGVLLSLGRVVTSAKTGIMRHVETAAYTSPDLAVSSTYYLRGKFVGNVFTFYVQKGTDSDAIPTSLVGTENGATGGGFDSTVLDILFAKIVTSTAGTMPTVTTLANNKLLEYYADFSVNTGSLAIGTEPKLIGTTAPNNTSIEWTKTVTINWARTYKRLTISGAAWTGTSGKVADSWQNRLSYTSASRYTLVGYVTSDWANDMTGATGFATINFGASA